MSPDPLESGRPQVALALDVPDRGTALALLDRLGPEPRIYKVGLELFAAEGPALVREVLQRGHRVFLDLKLHDIPNTVAGAVAVAARLGVEWLTVHTSGGPTMLEAAARAAQGGVRLLGVTVLTSLDAPALSLLLGRAPVDVEQEVRRRAGWALDAGLDGVVCSVAEASGLREAFGRRLLLVTPGIRLVHQGVDDQARVASPTEAARAGSDLLVIGRAVTGAADPAAALARVHAELAAAFQRT
ncbi:MAG: orotidine-5'-phosphate decarboxylase [Gemmatimonadota bacterium]